YRWSSVSAAIRSNRPLGRTSLYTVFIDGLSSINQCPEWVMTTSWTLVAAARRWARERRLAPSPPHRAHVRAAPGRQCPIGWVVGSAFPMDVAVAEHSGWPNPLSLTPFVMS